MFTANFEAFLTDAEGRSVPGSYRSGHNVFTNTGRDWVAKALAFATIGTFSPEVDDVPYDDGLPRFRWIGLGDGSQLERRGITRLVSPVEITAAPTYIKTLGTLTQPVPSSLKYTNVFDGTDFTHLGPSVTVSEAAVYVDRDGGSGPSLSDGDDDNVPVAYKTFDPLTKLAAQTLTIVWEFRL